MDPTPEQRLAGAVFQQALTDACKARGALRRQAEGWLLHGDGEVEFWCHLAGLNVMTVRVGVRRALEQRQARDAERSSGGEPGPDSVGSAPPSGGGKDRPSPGAQARVRTVHTVCRQTVNDLGLEGAAMSAPPRPFYPWTDRQAVRAGHAA